MNYNVIETWSTRFGSNPPGRTYSDWEAMDNSKDWLLGDELTGNYRLIATSTRPLSWPKGYFDKNPNSPTYNEFISTVDINDEMRFWPGDWALDQTITGQQPYHPLQLAYPAYLHTSAGDLFLYHPPG